MKMSKLSAAIAVATSMGVSQASMSQVEGDVSEPSDFGFLEEVVVTAQKRSESLQEIPISIRAVTADTLEQINADSLDDVARLVPSLSMTDITRGKNNVQIRGLGSNVGSVGTVALYNDGIISFGRIQSGGTFSEQDSALFDVERVEVLRGPQGTLYGEGSFGGVINIISKRPDAEKFEASISGTVYDVKEGSSDNTDFAAMVNIPLIEDKLALRVVGFRNDHDGYIDGYNALDTALASINQGIGQTYEALFPGFCSNPASPYAATFICTADPLNAPPQLLGKDLNTEKVTGGRVLLGYTSDDIDATLIYKTQKTELGIENYTSARTMGIFDSISGGTIGDTEFTRALFVPEFGSENTTDELVVEIELELPIGTLTSVTGWGDIDQMSSTTTADTGGFSEELRLSSKEGGALSWIVGAFYRTSERDVDLITGVDFSVNEVDQRSVFGQLYWDINDTLSATFGLRYGEQDTFINDQLNAASLGDLSKVDVSFDNVSPKVALDWRLDEVTLVYGSIAKGFRAGGANVDSSLGQDTSRFVQGFDSDEVWNYEIGYKADLFDNKVTANVAVFYIDWSDIQIDSPIDNIATGTSPDSKSFIVTNGKDAHSTGIEADIFIAPAEGWLITLGGSYVEAEFENGTITSNVIDAAHPDGVYELDGQRLPSAPEYLFNASVEKRFPVVEVLEGYVRVDYTLRDGSFSNVPNDVAGMEFESDTFELINLHAGLGGDGWEVQAFVKNATDEAANSFNFDDFNSLFLDLHARIAPRTVGVNVKLNF